MIGEIELDALTKRLEEKCDAVTMFAVTDVIKRQIKEIKQLNDQLTNSQRMCERLRRLYEHD